MTILLVDVTKGVCHLNIEQVLMKHSTCVTNYYAPLTFILINIKGHHS
jgi:hypothetical protein